MNKSNILLLALLSILTSAIFTSCSKENIDNENLNPDDVEVVTEVNDSTDVESCSELLVLQSELFTINGSGKAHLFKMGQNCETGGSNYALNYNVIDAEWDSWGVEPHIYHVTDGIPGLAFGIDSDTEVGDIVTLWRNIVGGESLILSTSLNENFALANDYQMEITSIGDEIGEFIGGKVSGELISQNGGNVFPFEASFCVEITFVCE